MCLTLVLFNTEIPFVTACALACPPQASWQRWRALLEGAGYAYRPFERRGETIVPDRSVDLKARGVQRGAAARQGGGAARRGDGLCHGV